MWLCHFLKGKRRILFSIIERQHCFWDWPESEVCHIKWGWRSISFVFPSICCEVPCNSISLSLSCFCYLHMALGSVIKLKQQYFGTAVGAYKYYLIHRGRLCVGIFSRVELLGILLVNSCVFSLSPFLFFPLRQLRSLYLPLKVAVRNKANHLRSCLWHGLPMCMTLSRQQFHMCQTRYNATGVTTGRMGRISTKVMANLHEEARVKTRNKVANMVGVPRGVIIL